MKKAWLKTKSLLLYLWKNVIFPNLIWTAIIGIPAILGYVGYAWHTVVQFSKSNNVPSNYFIITTITIVLCTILLVLYIIHFVQCRKSKKRRPVFPVLTSDYKITDAEYELFFKDRTHITQTQSANIISLKDNLEKIDHNMAWTGQSYIQSTLSSTCTGMTLTDTTRKTYPFQVTINFNKPLACGKEVFYEFQTIVEDPSCSMIPYLMKAVKCQTEKMTIKVTAPTGMLKNVKACIYADGMREIKLSEPVSIAPKRVGDYDLFEWPIVNLELLRYYGLEWDFA